VKVLAHLRRVFNFVEILYRLEAQVQVRNELLQKRVEGLVETAFLL